MTDPQWDTLLRTINSESLDPTPVGLIIDSPWLPGLAGVSMLDYFGDDRVWMQANLEAVRRFERVMMAARLLGRIRHVHRAVRLRREVRLP